MGRGLCLLALAVAAISLGSAAHPQAKGKPEQNEAAQIEQSSSRIADALGKIRPDKDQGCQDRKDQRTSDLCAQWSAVDAARNAAYATWAAVILTFVGTFLIFLTFLLQRKTSRAELRAYLSVKPQTFYTPGKSGKGIADFVIQNGGRTPAYNVVHSGAIFISGVPLPSDPGVIFQRPVQGTRAPAVIHSDDHIMGTINGPDPLEVEKHLEAIGKGDEAIYLVGEVRYRDTFGREHVTEFCRCLCGEDYKRSRSAAAANPGKAIPVQWGLANFHNDAT
jgi:hypothetical protein